MERSCTAPTAGRPPAVRRTTGRRTAAVLALGAACWTAIFTVAVAVDDFPRGLLVLALRRCWSPPGPGRACCAAAGAASPGSPSPPRRCSPSAVPARRRRLPARPPAARSRRADLAHRRAPGLPPAGRPPAGEPPARPVLFINPRSGDGKAARFRLATEARERGIEPIELRPGDDLAALVADGGGRRRRRRRRWPAATGRRRSPPPSPPRRDVPYACIPSGTRNHFALDLGVDRDDVVGALDAFVDGGERRGRPRRGQRPGVRQQRVAGRLRRGGAADRATGRPRSARCSTRCPAPSAPAAPPGPDLDHAGRTEAARRGGHPRRQQPVPPRRAPPGPAPARPWTRALLGITVVDPPSSRRQPPAAAVAAVVGAGVPRVDAAQPIPAGHRRRGGGAHLPRRVPHPARVRCACASPRTTPARRRRRSNRSAPWPRCARWRGSRRAVLRAAPVPDRATGGVRTGGHA